VHPDHPSSGRVETLPHPFKHRCKHVEEKIKGKTLKMWKNKNVLKTNEKVHHVSMTATRFTPGVGLDQL